MKMKRNDLFRIAVRRFAPFESAIQKQWEAFTSANTVDLQLDAASFDLHPLSSTLFAERGLEQGEWDVAFVSTDWIAAGAEAGCFVDLSSFIESDPPDDYMAGWSESLLRMQRTGQAVYGFPYHNGPECLLLRKDLFDNPKEQHEYQRRYGTRLEIPRTWSEFHRIARHFHRPLEGLYGTAFAAYPDGHNTVYDFLLQLWSRGGELFNATGEIHFATPKAIEALEFYRGILNDAGAVHPASRAMDSVKAGIAFMAGELAMAVNWFGFGAMAETLESSQVRGRVDVAAVPFEKGGSSVSLNSYWLLVIGKGSPHRELAYRFIKHCLSKPMDKLLTLEGGIGCRRSTWSDNEITTKIPIFTMLEGLHSTARELPSRSDWPHIASCVDSVMLDVMDTEESIASILGRADRTLRDNPRGG
jgi:multiple sugar transport system substrate-binding protein